MVILSGLGIILTSVSMERYLVKILFWSSNRATLNKVLNIKSLFKLVV